MFFLELNVNCLNWVASQIRMTLLLSAAYFSLLLQWTVGDAQVRKSCANQHSDPPKKARVLPLIFLIPFPRFFSVQLKRSKLNIYECNCKCRSLGLVDPAHNFLSSLHIC